MLYAQFSAIMSRIRDQTLKNILKLAVLSFRLSVSLSTYLGDLALAFGLKMTIQKHSSAQLCPYMFDNDFLILSLSSIHSLIDCHIRKRSRILHSIYLPLSIPMKIDVRWSVRLSFCAISFLQLIKNSFS